MYSQLLPIGSVVLLKEGAKRLLITSRVVAPADNGLRDYAGVLYPEGLTNEEALYFFNNDAIERVFALGYQDYEEAAFKQELEHRLELYGTSGHDLMSTNTAGDTPTRNSLGSGFTLY